MHSRIHRQLVSSLVILALMLAGFATVSHRFAPLLSAADHLRLSICSHAKGPVSQGPAKQLPQHVHAQDCAACFLNSVDFALPLPAALAPSLLETGLAESGLGADSLLVLAPLWQPSRSRAPPSLVLSL